MARYYCFALNFRVLSADTLAQAAAERAVAEGLSEEEWASMRTRDGEVESDLTMLLDPGSLPGCEILDSNVEFQETADVD
jgi:hypothetical protein